MRDRSLAQFLIALLTLFFVIILRQTIGIGIEILSFIVLQRREIITVDYHVWLSSKDEEYSSLG